MVLCRAEYLALFSSLPAVRHASVTASRSGCVGVAAPCGRETERKRSNCITLISGRIMYLKGLQYIFYFPQYWPCITKNMKLEQRNRAYCMQACFSEILEILSLKFLILSIIQLHITRDRNHFNLHSILQDCIFEYN